MKVKARRLRPKCPSEDPRYDRPAGSSTPTSSDGIKILLPAGICNAGPEKEDRVWKKHVHYEGLPYFHNAEAGILTTSNILDPSVKEEIETIFQQLGPDIEALRSINNWPAEVEIVLELANEGYCDYYCVSILDKNVFWLSEGDWLDIPCESSATTIQLKLREEYWTHITYFPMHRVLPVEDEECLRGVLVFSCADRMSAPGSTSHFTAEECRQYLYLLECSSSPTSAGARTWLISRLMTTITRNRIHNLWGQEGARLDRTQHTVALDSRPKSFIKKVLQGSVVQSVFFHMPAEYEKSLHFASVDDVVLPDAWKSFVETLQRDWKMAIALALGLLLAEACLLSKDVNKGLIHDATIASAAFTVASIGAGLHLLQSHRGLEESNAHVAASYLLQHESEALGYTTLAIRLAAPYALMIWGFLAFSTALFLSIQQQ